MQSQVKYKLMIESYDGLYHYDHSIEVPFLPILPIGSSCFFSEETRYKLEKMIYNCYRIDYFQHTVSGLYFHDMSIDEYRSKISEPTMSDNDKDAYKPGYIDTSDFIIIKDYVWDEVNNELYIIINK
jgi:hypothetical protein